MELYSPAASQTSFTHFKQKQDGAQWQAVCVISFCFSLYLLNSSDSVLPEVGVDVLVLKAGWWACYLGFNTEWRTVGEKNKFKNTSSRCLKSSASNKLQGITKCLHNFKCFKLWSPRMNPTEIVQLRDLFWMSPALQSDKSKASTPCVLKLQ